MCEYTGKLEDPQRHTKIILPDNEVTESAKKMLNIPLEDCSRTGLAPFCADNQPPPVRLFCLFLYTLIRSHQLSLTCYDSFMQANNTFWKKKAQDKPAKPTRKKTFAVKKKKAVVASGSNPEEDDPASEVLLASSVL